MAWRRFARGKWSKAPVREFWFRLEQHLNALYHDLHSGRYRHGAYEHFVVCDPKRRDIYVPTVRDRVVHQLISDYLSSIYAARFYPHSYAAQTDKGVQMARAYAFCVMRRLYGHGDVWVGKLDVKQYFANVDHGILLSFLRRRIRDERIIALCTEVLSSFGNGRGIPLGNLTSQWFGNIYLHEADYFIKHTLRVRYYVRYNDDFILIGHCQRGMMKWMNWIRRFAQEQLSLSIPIEKTSLAALPGAVDILGMRTNGHSYWLRPATVRRGERRLREMVEADDTVFLDALCSYAGIGMETGGIVFLPDFG